MADLSSVRVKINRAKKHLADLEAAIVAFEANRPWAVIPNGDGEPGKEIYQFRLFRAIPNDWGAILGDCVHNLRTSLDYVAHELVRFSGGTPYKYTAFPIAPNEISFRTSLLPSYLKGASTDICKVVSRLKPYDGGNNAFWRLHGLDIADKHHLLVPVATAHQKLGIQWGIIGPGMEWTRDYPSPMLYSEPDRKFPLKDGDILGVYNRVVTPGYDDQTKFDFGFEIAFGDGQIFDGEAIVPTLQKLVDFTERVIDIFARRILKISW